MRREKADSFYSCGEWQKLVFITVRPHPFPSRTRKLSSPVPKILGGKLPGKIGLCQQKLPLSFVLRGIFVFVWMVYIICRSFDPVPAQGATDLCLKLGVEVLDSIPAPAQGATLPVSSLITPLSFQSPPPRRGRRPPFSLPTQQRCFNPRPRAGGDSTLA